MRFGKLILFVSLNLMLASCADFRGERFYEPESLPPGPGMFSGEKGQWEFEPLR